MFTRNKKKEDSVSELEKITALFWPDFVESKGGLIFVLGNWCDLPRENKKMAISLYHETERSDYFDSTDYESSVNHYHLEDHLPYISKHKMKKYAYQIAQMWRAKIKLDYPDRHFRLYLEKTILRFHQVHPGESAWLNAEDFPKQVAKGEIIIWEW